MKLMKAGYSTKSLADKLGVQPNTNIVALNAPRHYGTLLGKLPDGSILKSTLDLLAEKSFRRAN